MTMMSKEGIAEIQQNKLTICQVNLTSHLIIWYSEVIRKTFSKKYFNRLCINWNDLLLFNFTINSIIIACKVCPFGIWLILHEILLWTRDLGSRVSFGLRQGQLLLGRNLMLQEGRFPSELPLIDDSSALCGLSLLLPGWCVEVLGLFWVHKRRSVGWKDQRDQTFFLFPWKHRSILYLLSRISSDWKVFKGQTLPKGEYSNPSLLFSTSGKQEQK